ISCRPLPSVWTTQIELCTSGDPADASRDVDRRAAGSGRDAEPVRGDAPPPGVRAPPRTCTAASPDPPGSRQVADAQRLTLARSCLDVLNRCLALCSYATGPAPR